MMVEHDDIHAAFAQPGDGFHGGRAAVHGEQQFDGKFLQAILHAVVAQAVAFVHAVRQIKIHLPAKRAQNFQQQRGGSHAVHVVIAENDQRLVAFAGAEQPLDGGGHVRQQKRVGEIFQPRREEVRDGRRLAEAAVEQALREQRRNFELRRELSGEQRLRRRERSSGISFFI